MTPFWRPRTWLFLVLLVSLAGLLVAQVPTYPRLRWGGGHSGVLAEVSSAGGALTLRPGIGTGTAVPAPVVVGASVLGTASGTGAQAQVTRHTFGTTKILTDAAAIAIVQATLANGSVHASRYQYAVEVTNGTDFQIEEGLATCHVTNKAGAIANNTCVKASNQQAMTAGTLTVTFAISAANPAVISVNADSSLTPSAGYPRLTYELVNLTQQTVAVQ